MAYDQRSLDDYVDVAERIQEFRAAWPQGTLRGGRTRNPYPPGALDTAMCECSHHWYVHRESGYTNQAAICHGRVGSATPGPYEPCRCTGFAQWTGPRDSRTGEPIRPITLTTAARALHTAACDYEDCFAEDHLRVDLAHHPWLHLCRVCIGYCQCQKCRVRRNAE